MRNPEVPKTPEINKFKLLQFLDTLEISDYQGFSFESTNFNIIVMEEDNHGDPFFAESTLISGYDIYIPHARSEKDKRILFHEIMECLLIDQGIPQKEAHITTKAEEQKIFDGVKEG